MFTLVQKINCLFSKDLIVWKVIGSNLSPNCVIIKTLKVYLLLISQTRDINSIKKENDLAIKQTYTITIRFTAMTFIQRSCNQRVGCLQQFGPTTSRCYQPSTENNLTMKCCNHSGRPTYINKLQSRVLKLTRKKKDIEN